MTAAAAPLRPDVPSLSRLLDPAILRDPHRLYRRLREAGPVIWDPYLHTWVVTGYREVVKVLQTFSADRTPTPRQLRAMGMAALEPVAEVMVRQMLFMDGAAHARLRAICSAVFTSRRVRQIERRIHDVCNDLLAQMRDGCAWDLLAGFAEPMPAIITAELLGLPGSDWAKLKGWSASFAGLLGNFQHSPDQIQTILRAAEELCDYVRREVAEQRLNPRDGMIRDLLASGADDGFLDDERIVANVIVTLVGGLETTTNLIASGLVTLIAHPQAITEIKQDPALTESAVEELLRYESPSQHTGRIAPADMMLGDQAIAKGDAVMAVMAAANRDPEIFHDPDHLDIRRTPNRHVAFAWGPHFCFGAPLARMEARIAFDTILARTDGVALSGAALEWRDNLGLRGLKALDVVPSISRESARVDGR